jgi:hypothetical protein
MPSKRKAPSDFKDNVFINCPFDEDYKPIFDAIVFAIHDMGFVARTAREEIDSSETRLKKILRIIRGCRYGVHDISRQGSRFNMPFECGLFWGCKKFGESYQKQKRILILDEKPFDYQKTLSDIAGQDIQYHDADPYAALCRVREFLANSSRRRNIPGGKAIWNRYLVFREELPAMVELYGITQKEIKQPEYYRDYVNFVVDWLQISEETSQGKK